MPTIRVNNINMYYKIHREGKPLVLIGGLGIDLSEPGSISHWLAQRYQVLTFDNRGAGRTSKPDMPYSIEMMASDTTELLDTLASERLSVLGISLGGRIALTLALQHPEKAEKLIIIQPQNFQGTE